MAERRRISLIKGKEIYGEKVNEEIYIYMFKSHIYIREEKRR